MSTSAGATSPGASRTDGAQPTTHTPTALIAFAWALVGVPLAYGLYNTVVAASALFTGG